MKRKINKIKMYIKNSNDAKETAKIIREKLLENNFQVVEKNFDLALSIGGDGTFLKMVHENKFNNNIIYSGINAGALGYLTSIEKENIDEFIKILNNDCYITKEIDYLKTIIDSEDNNTEINSLNEIVIKKENGMLLKCMVNIDNQFLENYVGDGLLISTSCGSTGYNISFGGAIIDPDSNSYTITPIAPINNKIFKSLTYSVILAKKKNTIITFNSKENISIISDGKIININGVKRIKSSLMNKKIQYITINNHNFAEKINSKII